jgi:hypothetical protein
MKRHYKNCANKRCGGTSDLSSEPDMEFDVDETDEGGTEESSEFVE